MKISHLTTGEEIIMNILWRLDSAYMREIIEQYPEPKPHPNTISTFLKILVEKEFLTTRKEGRIFQYNVAIPFKDYRKYLLNIFLEEYFNNSSSELIKLLHEENLLKDADFEIKAATILNPEKEKDSELSEFLNDITAPKKKKKKKEKDGKKKNKKKNK
ncbi:BlaI/MecI/CopY family transcriptional regulator [Kaistella sp.]|uniref:BlaI/MecI/CopY family transcriptional regulator n=1 Tax=Kaistella sp. TaxID=2782235 RepID=UPI003C4C8F70